MYANIQRPSCPGLRSEVQNDSECFVQDPCTLWSAPIRAGSTLHCWTQQGPRDCIIKTCSKLSWFCYRHNSCASPNIRFAHIIQAFSERTEASPVFGGNLHALKISFRTPGCELFQVFNQWGGAWRYVFGLARHGSTIGFHLLWHTVEIAMSTRLCLL